MTWRTRSRAIRCLLADRAHLRRLRTIHFVRQYYHDADAHRTALCGEAAALPLGYPLQRLRDAHAEQIRELPLDRLLLDLSVRLDERTSQRLERAVPAGQPDKLRAVPVSESESSRSPLQHLGCHGCRPEPHAGPLLQETRDPDARRIKVEDCLEGGTWQDFDEACIGPREWDIASMIHRWVVFGELEQEMRVALTAYGPCDVEGVEALQRLVVLGIASWLSLAPLIGESLSPRTEHRLEWLRRH